MCNETSVKGNCEKRVFVLDAENEIIKYSVLHVFDDDETLLFTTIVLKK